MFAEITKKSDILCVSVTSDIYYVSKKILGHGVGHMQWNFLANGHTSLWMMEATLALLM
jgi:hypothetical protein